MGNFIFSLVNKSRVVECHLNANLFPQNVFQTTQRKNNHFVQKEETRGIVYITNKQH